MIPDRAQVSDELNRLIDLQREFYENDPTPEQVQEFELSNNESVCCLPNWLNTKRRDAMHSVNDVYAKPDVPQCTCNN